MAVQNLVSAILTAELKASIEQLLEELKNKCSFIITLTPDEIKGIFKAGDGYSTFLDKAYNACVTYPQILSPVFDKDEFIKDYIFAAELQTLIGKFGSLMEALRNTETAALSDTMSGALEVYAAVQQNKDKVPGLNSVYEEMAKHFKKSRSSKEQPK